MRVPCWLSQPRPQHKWRQWCATLSKLRQSCRTTRSLTKKLLRMTHPKSHPQEAQEWISQPRCWTSLIRREGNQKNSVRAEAKTTAGTVLQVQAKMRAIICCGIYLCRLAARAVRPVTRCMSSHKCDSLVTMSVSQRF